LRKRKKPTVKEPLSKRAKPSPTTIPLTHDVPIPSPIRDNTHMEDIGDQFGSIPEANPMTEVTAKDVVQGKEAPSSSHGHMADMPAGGSLLWKQKQLEII
jgi:hypothetical protein